MSQQIETVSLPAEAIVVRFSPVDVERMMGQAATTERFLGVYGLSVFADAPSENESRIDSLTRILEASEVVINPDRNPQFWSSTAGEIADRGFTFYKRKGSKSEVREHYGVNIGDDHAEESYQQFIDAFTPERRPSPNDPTN